jgi:hypothetical protein
MEGLARRDLKGGTNMTLRIVSVAFLDWQATGADHFFVQTSEEEVMLYEANQNGSVQAVIDEPAPLRFVTASIEKFNNMYRVENPVDLATLDELPSYIGKFEITSETSCRYVG